jgi:hypothetical protein
LVQIFFHSCKFCGHLIPCVPGEALSIETLLTWDIPTYADEKIFHPWLHSCSLPLCDHSKAHDRQVATFGLATTELVPHHWAEGHDRYFGNASLWETLILNGCIPTLTYKSNRDYNLSLPLLLWWFSHKPPAK